MFSFAYNPSVSHSFDSSLPRKEPYAALHESACAMNRIATNAEGDSCSLLQFMTRSVKSCNAVAIHCKESFAERSNLLSIKLSLCFKSKLGIQNSLSKTERLWSYLDKLIVCDILNCLLKRKNSWWNEDKCLVRAL